MKHWMSLWVMGAVCAGLLVGCSSQKTRPGVIVAYGDTSVSISDLESDPIIASDARVATREDVLDLQTRLVCQHPEGVSALQERAFFTQELQARDIDQGSFNALNEEILLTSEFMDALAMELNLRCPAQLAKLLGQ